MCSIEWWHAHWPWRTRNPDFKVTAFLSRISLKWCISSQGQICCRTLIGKYRWRIDPCRFQWPWVTFKGRMLSIFFRRILITLVRSATSLHLHKCVARFVSDDWVFLLMFSDSHHLECRANIALILHVRVCNQSLFNFFSAPQVNKDWT